MKNLICTFSLLLTIFVVGCDDDNSINTKKDNNKIDTINVSTDTVKIGLQVWATKNLDVDHYSNGDSIPQITDLKDLPKLTTGAWCYYNNDTTIGKVYGKLYNWYAVVDPRGLAPKGWHIPSDEEWTELVTYLSGDSIAGGKLKEEGYSHWKFPNTGATNESGFFAVPGGLSLGTGYFDLGLYCNWWTSTEGNPTWKTSLCRGLSYKYNGIARDNDPKVNCYSVRCVKD